MTFAVFDDGFDDDPAYADLDLAAMGLIAAGITYAHRHLTDGRIPRSWPRRRWGKAGEHAVANLLRDGIWMERSDGDLEIVGFLSRYPSRAEVFEQRAISAELKAKAGRAGGLKSGEVRRAKARAEAAARTGGGEANTKQTPSRRQADANQNEALSDPLRSSPIQDPPLPPEENPGGGIVGDHASLPPEAHAAIREDAELERGTSTPLRQGGAAFEVATTAFAEAVGAVTGSGFGFTPLTRIHFVAAVNAHAPAGLHGRDLEQRIRVSASRFASDRQEKGHAISIQAWLDWLNSGNGWTLAKARPVAVAVAKARSTAPPPKEPPMSFADIAAHAEATLLEIERGSGVVPAMPIADAEGSHATT